MHAVVQSGRNLVDLCRPLHGAGRFAAARDRCRDEADRGHRLAEFVVEFPRKALALLLDAGLDQARHLAVFRQLPGGRHQAQCVGLGRAQQAAQEQQQRNVEHGDEAEPEQKYRGHVVPGVEHGARGIRHDLDASAAQTDHGCLHALTHQRIEPVRRAAPRLVAARRRFVAQHAVVRIQAYLVGAHPPQALQVIDHHCRRRTENAAGLRRRAEHLHGDAMRGLDFLLDGIAVVVHHEPGQRNQEAQVKPGHQQVEAQAQAHWRALPRPFRSSRSISK